MTQQVLSRPFRYISAALCAALVLTLLPFGRFASAQIADVSVDQLSWICGDSGSVTVQFTLTPPGSVWLQAEVLTGDESTITDFGTVTESGSVSGSAVIANGSEILVYGFDPAVGPSPNGTLLTDVVVADCAEVPPVPTVVPTPTAPAPTPTPTAPAVTPTPTPTVELPPVDPTTPTPVPTQDVLLPSPPPDNSTPVAQPTNPIVQTPAPPEVQESESPSEPAPLVINIVVAAPVPATNPIPEVSRYSKPGDIVRVNIAAPGEPPVWKIMTVPDPEGGLPKFENDQDRAAFKALLSAIIVEGNIYFTKPVQLASFSIRIERQEAPLLEYHERSGPKRALMSFAALMPSNDDPILGPIMKAMVITAIITAVAFPVAYLSLFGTGTGILFDAGASGTVFLAAASQETGTYQPIFHFYMGPGNQWQLPPFPPGSYLLKIETVEGEVYNLPFTMTGDPNEYLVIEQTFWGGLKITNEQKTTDVVTFPQTGSGHENKAPLEILGLATIGLGLLTAFIRVEVEPLRKRK